MPKKFPPYLTALAMVCSVIMEPGNAAPLVIDHLNTDLSQIPPQWIDSAKTNIRWHYVRKSHGSQLDIGMESLMADSAKYGYTLGSYWFSNGRITAFNVPTESNSLCTMIGSGDYVNYWQGVPGNTDTSNLTDFILSQNPAINVSMFMWCTELNYAINDDKFVQQYLDSMEAYEKRYPTVRFVYTTGNAQDSGENGYNRQRRNMQIRNWVVDHPEKNRVLYDFADIESWRFNHSTGSWEHSTYEYSSGGTSITIELQHHYYDPGAQEYRYTHTTQESCVLKANAAWWMFARLAGWQGNLKTGTKEKIKPFGHLTGTPSERVGIGRRSGILSTGGWYITPLGRKIGVSLPTAAPSTNFLLKANSSGSRISGLLFIR